MKKVWATAVGVLVMAAAMLVLSTFGWWPFSPAGAPPAAERTASEHSASQEPASTPPSTTATASETSSRPATKSYSATAEGARFTFRYPATWSVSPAGGMPAHYVMKDAAGKEQANLDILIAWGAECPCDYRPVENFPDALGEFPLSKSGDFVVRTVAMDLHREPAAVVKVGWPKPVALLTSLTLAGPQPSRLATSYLYGLGLIETGQVAANGVTYRTVLFTSGQYFDDLGQARAYVETEQFRSVRAMIASFNG